MKRAAPVAEETGRRAGDSDYLSFREAVDMFATKVELERMTAEMRSIAMHVNQLPTRSELAAHRGRLEDKVEAVGCKLDGLTEQVTTLTENRLPKWVLPAAAFFAAIIMPIMVVVISHFWVVPVPGK